MQDLTNKTENKLEQLIEQLANKALYLKNSSKMNKTTSSARLAVLQFLMEQGAASLKSITEHRQVTAATMSRLVASLITEGLVLKANSKKDKRSKLFFISSKGRQGVIEHKSRVSDKLSHAIQGLTTTEQLLLDDSIKLIGKMISNIR